MSNTPVLPSEVWNRIVLEIHHFPTLRALSITSKTLSAIACQSLLTLALAQDRCRMRDPGSLVYGFDLLPPGAGNSDDDHVPPPDDAEFEGAFRMPLGRPTFLSDSTTSASSASALPPPSCAAAAYRYENTKAASLPVVLWASLQPPDLALAFLVAIERADLRHIWAIFMIPSTTCGTIRRPWSPTDFPIPSHTMSNALHTAARHGNTDVVRWLLDREHLAIYHRSVLWPHLGSIASPWVMKPVDIPTVPPCLCPSRHTDAYLAATLNAAPDDDGLPWITALHIALAHNQIDTARLLVERGANWATAPFGTRGITALMVVCANGIVPFLDYLIEQASSCIPEAWQPLTSQPRDFNGCGYSHYMSTVGSGATRRRLESRLEALEMRLHANGGNLQHTSWQVQADGH